MRYYAWDIPPLEGEAVEQKSSAYRSSISYNVYCTERRSGMDSVAINQASPVFVHPFYDVLNFV